MLKIQGVWDWFFEPMTPEEEKAIAEKRLSAHLREDGDDEAAIVAAVRGVDAPDEHTRLLLVDPCVGRCFLAIAWDDRFVECVEHAEDETD